MRMKIILWKNKYQ